MSRRRVSISLSQREKEASKKRLEEFRRKIHEKQANVIAGKISEEEHSIHVVSTCFQPFESSNESGFVFWRTDPLYLSREMNFDLVLFSSTYNTICLIECKSDLTKRLESKVSDLQRKIDLVEQNNWIEVEGNRIRIRDYFEQALNVKKPHFYYVLASEIVDLGNSFDLVQVSDYPFDIWRCQWVFSGIKIQRTPIPSRRDEERNISIASLTAYLDKIHPPAGDTIQICLSSNKYYLAVQSCINLQRLESFIFDDFLASFSIDLKDYEEFEKRYLFELFIDFGEECNFLKISEDTGDIFTSSYAIVNRGMNSTQLQKNIVSKMAEQKVKTDPGIVKKIEEKKEMIINQVHEKELKRKKQTRLTDFEGWG